MVRTINEYGYEPGQFNEKPSILQGPSTWGWDSWVKENVIEDDPLERNLRFKVKDKDAPRVEYGILRKIPVPLFINVEEDIVQVDETELDRLTEYAVSEASQALVLLITRLVNEVSPGKANDYYGLTKIALENNIQVFVTLVISNPRLGFDTNNRTVAVRLTTYNLDVDSEVAPERLQESTEEESRVVTF